MIKENYMDYEKVKESFKNFIHTLVWESMEIDEGVIENDINEHINAYCETMGDGVIHDINKHVNKYFNSLNSRYTITMKEMSNGGWKEVANFKTNNLKLVLSKAAKFYKSAKKRKVTIFDNETSEYIAEWE